MNNYKEQLDTEIEKLLNKSKDAANYMANTNQSMFDYPYFKKVFMHNEELFRIIYNYYVECYKNAKSNL